MKRLISLDFFRGLTIALMIVVNSPGSWEFVYPPLRHAVWHGATPTDLVFPFFLFIVGVSIALAYSKKKTEGSVHPVTYRKIIIRTVKIFLLGLFLALFPLFDFSNLRVAGVLQRISIVFLVCAVLYLRTDWKTQLRIGIVLLIGYWLAMWLIPVPGIGRGILEPGLNLAAYVDSYITPGRLYRDTWDPEGFFSTIPAIGSGITGLLVGHVLLAKQLSQNKKIIWIFFAGFVGFLLGNIWAWWFPLNKYIWTSSFVLFTSGLGAMFLAAAMWLIDELKVDRWSFPGVVFGMNAITAYVLHGIAWRLFTFPIYEDMGIKSVWMEYFPTAIMTPEFASLLWALGYTAFCYVFIWIMYKRKIFLKV